jgi:DNA topoisomerase-2
MCDESAFGTRRMKGKDAASPRYLYTHPTDICRKIYSDDYKDIIDKEDTNEPKLYLPLFPILLINGYKGIGAGYRSNIPPHSPVDVINYYLNRLDGKSTSIPLPAFNEYIGRVIRVNNDILVIGFATVSSNEIVITEIPPEVSIDKYSEWLANNNYDFVSLSANNPHFIVKCELNVRDTISIFECKLDDAIVTTIRNSLIKKINIECVIFHNERILTLTIEELFDLCYTESLRYQKLLRTKNRQRCIDNIKFIRSKMWCIKELIQVELRSIDPKSYLTDRLKLTKQINPDEFDMSTISIDYRLSQLNVDYIRKLEGQIDEESKVLDYWTNKKEKLLRDFLHNLDLV